ncbi:hypothetical protein REPUB_Repub10bG0155300 [Reevesia pubescens]
MASKVLHFEFTNEDTKPYLHQASHRTKSGTLVANSSTFLAGGSCIKATINCQISTSGNGVQPAPNRTCNLRWYGISDQARFYPG